MWRDLSQELTRDLTLLKKPIGLAFTNAAPVGIEILTDKVPSACTFWKLAEDQLFYAPNANHLNCPIGAVTMGCELTDPVKAELNALVDNMVSCGYLSHEDARRLPSIKSEKAGIVYGPLEFFTIDPDLILMWMNAGQAMLYCEVSARLGVKAQQIMGKPGCSALPEAVNSQQSAISLGCDGMRTFTGITSDQMLVVLPGGMASEVVRELRNVVAANCEMHSLYNSKKLAFSMAK